MSRIPYTSKNTSRATFRVQSNIKFSLWFNKTKRASFIAHQTWVELTRTLPEMRTAQHASPLPWSVDSREKRSKPIFPPQLTTVGEFALVTPLLKLHVNDKVKNRWAKKIIAVEDATYAQACLAFFSGFPFRNCMSRVVPAMIFFAFTSSSSAVEYNIWNSHYKVTYFTLLASPAISLIIP